MPYSTNAHTQSDIFLTMLALVEDVMNRDELKKSLTEFITLWGNAKDITLDSANKSAFASRLRHFIGLDMEGNQYAVLSDKPDPLKLIVENGALITDVDLTAKDDAVYDAIRNGFDAKTDLFIKAAKAQVLPEDIRTLEDFVFGFSLTCHTQHRLYLHEKALEPLTHFAQRVIAHNPIMLDERYDGAVENLHDLTSDDHLSSDSMHTNLTLYILQRAGLKNIEKLLAK